ncbi:MAG: AMP-binding protein [Actinobacteria bacterium]|nr:AMP-binding protein [Actinomycetota bacterium]
MGGDNMNIGNIPARNAVQFPDKTALVFEDRRWTWRELNGRINRLSSALMSLGLGKGDKAAILTENVPAMVELNYACAKAGIVFFPVMSRLSPPDIQYLLDLSDAKILFYHPDFAAAVEGMRPQLKKVGHYVQIGGELPRDTLDYEDLLRGGGEDEPGVEVLPEDIYCFLCTGGTTGVSKLAMCSHLNALCAIYTTISALGIRPDDVGIQVLPLFHVIQNNCLHPLLAAGATVVLQHRFDPVAYMRAIQEEKVTLSIVVPPFLFGWIMSVPEAMAYDASSVRVFATAAATFPDELKKAVLQHMPSARLYYTYGLTESSGGNATVLYPDNAFRKPDSIGVVNPLLDYRIVNEAGEEVPPGEIGELLLKGPAVIKGYYKREDETEKTFRDGWLHTGDIVRRDEEGFLYFVDRLKDMIKTGGENVFAKEVEDALLGHPKVAEAAVFGLPDPQWGEKIHAAVVLKPGEEATEEEILAFCREALPGFKRPKVVYFVPVLPRNPSGKVLKHVLKEEFPA